MGCFQDPLRHPRDAVTAGQPSQLLSWSVTQPTVRAGTSAHIRTQVNLDSWVHPKHWLMKCHQACSWLKPPIHFVFFGPSPSSVAGKDATAPGRHRTQRCRLHKWEGRNEEWQKSLSLVQPPLSFVHRMFSKLRDVLPTPWKVAPSNGCHHFSLYLLWDTNRHELLGLYFLIARGPGWFKSRLTMEVCLRSNTKSTRDQPEPIQTAGYNLCFSRTSPSPQLLPWGPATRLLGKPSWGSEAGGTPNLPLQPGLCQEKAAFFEKVFVSCNTCLISRLANRLTEDWLQETIEEGRQWLVHPLLCISGDSVLSSSCNPLPPARWPACDSDACRRVFPLLRIRGVQRVLSPGQGRRLLRASCQGVPRSTGMLRAGWPHPCS